MSVAVVAWRHGTTPPTDPVAARPVAGSRLSVARDPGSADGALLARVGDGDPAVSASPAAPGPVDRLWIDGSLRGTVLDGDWGRWVDGRLQPSFGLRQRFDALLSTQGEVAVDDLRRWVAARVGAAHGSAGAAQVLDLWDRYLQVQSAPYARQADPNDVTTWQPALAEHDRVRRALLGSAWAEAFYGAEARALAADAQRRLSASTGATSTGPSAGSADALLAPSVAPADDTAAASRLQAARTDRFGVEAADRLRANDAAWRAWDERIEAARAAATALANDPALSTQQREEARTRLLNDGFAPAERVRARGLIETAPAAASKVGDAP